MRHARQKQTKVLTVIDLVSVLELADSEANQLLKRSQRRVALRDIDREPAPPKAYLNDRPSMNGDMVVFVSTEEDVGKPVQGWNAVYSLNFKTSVTRRLTPLGVTDYSPALSPSGKVPISPLTRFPLVWCYKFS